MVEFLIEFQHSPKVKEDWAGGEGEDDCDEFDFHPNALPSRPIRKPQKVTVNLLKIDNKGKETREIRDITAYSKHFPLIYPWVRAKIFFTEPLDDDNSSPQKLVEQGHFKVSEYSLNNQQGHDAINIFFTSICDLIQERNLEKGFLQNERNILEKYLTKISSSEGCFLGKVLFDCLFYFISFSCQETLRTSYRVKFHLK